MNIFILDTNPATAAHMHCDKHVPKMCRSGTDDGISPAPTWCY